MACGVLVAEMVEGGIEFMFGARRDPVFDLMGVFSLGGIFVEALKEAQIAPAPLDRSQACFLLEGIRGASLLRGTRGRQAADIDRLADLLCRLGEFALANAAYV